MRASRAFAAGIVTVCALIHGCGDGSTRACFGSIEFCEDSFGRNLAPEARAGADREVEAGERVQLDGTDSFDRDGHITSYSWTQHAGPTVALEDAGQAVAEFVAPEVEEETFLDFRLVVTDDRRASDSEQVRVTVLPATAIALHRGVRLLKDLYRPEPFPSRTQPPGRSGALGLWLAARVRAAAAGAEPELDALLDELRVIETVYIDEALAHASAPDQRLLRLAQQDIARFTHRRDPATAELARRHRAEGGATSGAWQRAILAAYPQLGWVEGPAPVVRTRARRLLGAAQGRLTVEAAAAATLLLAPQAIPATDRAAGASLDQRESRGGTAWDRRRSD